MTLEGGGGGTISNSILGEGGKKHFFLLILYNFKNIGGGGTCPPTPRSLLSTFLDASSRRDFLTRHFLIFFKNVLAMLAFKIYSQYSLLFFTVFLTS